MAGAADQLRMAQVALLDDVRKKNARGFGLSDAVRRERDVAIAQRLINFLLFLAEGFRVTQHEHDERSAVQRAQAFNGAIKIFDKHTHARTLGPRGHGCQSARINA